MRIRKGMGLGKERMRRVGKGLCEELAGLRGQRWKQWKNERRGRDTGGHWRRLPETSPWKQLPDLPTQTQSTTGVIGGRLEENPGKDW